MVLSGYLLCESNSDLLLLVSFGHADGRVVGTHKSTVYPSLLLWQIC